MPDQSQPILSHLHVTVSQNIQSLSLLLSIPCLFLSSPPNPIHLPLPPSSSSFTHPPLPLFLCLSPFLSTHIITPSQQTNSHGEQKKAANGKPVPTKPAPAKAKTAAAKAAKAKSAKVVVKPPMPTKAAKPAVVKPSKAKPTAVEVLLSKIRPTAAAAKKSSAEKKVKAEGKAKANTNGKAVVTKATSSTKVSNGNGKVTVEKKVVKTVVEKKVNGLAKANGKAAVVKAKASAADKKANGAAKPAKTETSMKAKVTKVQKTVVSATKSAATKAPTPKPTNTPKAQTPKATKAAATKSSHVTKVTTIVTKVPVVKTTMKSFLQSSATKRTATSLPVLQTTTNGVRSKPTVDLDNVKSLHKPFPPFGKTALSGTGLPVKRPTSGYQQVQQDGPGPVCCFCLLGYAGPSRRGPQHQDQSPDTHPSLIQRHSLYILTNQYERKMLQCFSDFRGT